MSEKRETWLEWSDLVGRYSVGQDEPTCVAEILAANKAKWFQATDWRPTRVPPPAEIEALQRDAAILNRVRGFVQPALDIWQDNEPESSGAKAMAEVLEWALSEDTQNAIETLTQLDAAMEGGE